MNNQSPFVVENLTPKSATGAPTATYELTKSSVSPSRIVGRDRRGFPIEETEPTVHWAPFLMLDGCINKVPLRTGSVLSMQAEATAYETETVTELVTLGCIPATMCPHSTKYAHLTGGAFVPGGQDCGGIADKWQAYVSGGCQHLKEVAAARKAEVLERHNAEASIEADKAAAEYRKMVTGIVEGVSEGVGAAMARNITSPSGAARKANLRDGKADE